MGKRINFEEVLKGELRWPQKGDTPFQQSDNLEQNANIDNDDFSRLVMMMEGYKRAGDVMVEKSKESNIKRDSLVFPIIFNYRQFIELSLKYLISIYGPSVEIKANWHTHNLETLWREFTKVLDCYGTTDPDEADPVVEHIVAEFSKIDPGSYSYRYPVDRNGDPIPVTKEALDLEALADVMESVEAYFKGSDGYLDSIKSAV